MKKWLMPLVVLSMSFMFALPAVAVSANAGKPIQLSHIPGPCDAGVEIRKQAEGPDSRTFSSGSNVAFEIEVTNPCDGNLTDVAVSDPLLPACDRNIGNLAPGGSVTYTCTDNNVTSGYTNVARVTGTFTGDGGTGDPEQRSDSDESTVVIEEPPPAGGGEGCTPGYWKQRHHSDSWATYNPDDDYEDIFGVDASFDKTLLGALKQGGGGEKALGRHAVAALLNAASGDVSYAFTTSEVITLVQNAYATGDFEGAKNALEAENEQGCPLN